METITIILILLIAVVLAGTLARAVPIPKPLIQIALGAGIGLVANWRVTLDPEVFFVLILPPLMFLDGWRIPREDLFKDSKTVLGLALGLVVFTVLGMGMFIHWMIPAMPLPVAFALAAIISPTDPIAVSAIAQRVAIPKRMMHILEGESLLNDASGLVCFRFAVAAMLTGVFSIGAATLTFLWMALGGLAVGVAVTWGAARIKSWVTRHLGEEGGAQILISILLPFAAYLAAEYLHCSGILAAVAAGLTMGFVETRGDIQAVTRIRRNTVWDTIQYTVNGIIFVLLGEQLPGIVASAENSAYLVNQDEGWWLLVYVAAIVAGLALLRFIWVWISLRFTMFRHKIDGRPNWRLVTAMSLAGVRGAVTLAGILTLPLTLADGSAFPARNLAICLAMGVIIFSLLIASFLLPLVLRRLEMPPEPEKSSEEDAARIAAAQAAIVEVQKTENALAKGREDADLYVAAASNVMDAYRQRIESREAQDEDRRTVDAREQIERQLRLVGLRAERSEIFRLARAHQLNSETARKLVREIDLMEARLTPMPG